MRWTASLPMYNLPEMRAVNARFWGALRALLRNVGLRDVPASLRFERQPVPYQIGPEVLFSQTCGYPLETIYRGQAVRLGTPCYGVPGCDGPTHCGFFMVKIASEARFAGLRYDLLLVDIRDAPDAAYRGPLDYEREAALLGYPSWHKGGGGGWTDRPR
jgi:hypothetical protein